MGVVRGLARTLPAGKRDKSSSYSGPDSRSGIQRWIRLDRDSLIITAEITTVEAALSAVRVGATGTIIILRFK